jgi:hypothetical protein
MKIPIVICIAFCALDQQVISQTAEDYNRPLQGFLAVPNYPGIKNTPWDKLNLGGFVDGFVNKYLFTIQNLDALKEQKTCIQKFQKSYTPLRDQYIRFRVDYSRDQLMMEIDTFIKSVEKDREGKMETFIMQNAISKVLSIFFEARNALVETWQMVPLYKKRSDRGDRPIMDCFKSSVEEAEKSLSTYQFNTSGVQDININSCNKMKILSTDIDSHIKSANSSFNNCKKLDSVCGWENVSNIHWWLKNAEILV